MSNFKKSNANPLKNVTIKKDKESHISIEDRNKCLDNCENKPCTYFCPARVFYWENNKINILYERCVECGACPWGCPYENIDWSFPRGGYGVLYGDKLND